MRRPCIIPFLSPYEGGKRKKAYPQRRRGPLPGSKQPMHNCRVGADAACAPPAAFGPTARPAYGGTRRRRSKMKNAGYAGREISLVRRTKRPCTTAARRNVGRSATAHAPQVRQRAAALLAFPHRKRLCRSPVPKRATDRCDTNGPDPAAKGDGAAIDPVYGVPGSPAAKTYRAPHDARTADVTAK